MKNILIVVCIGWLFVACSSEATQENALRAFIPGRYVRAIAHEFAVGGDTLVVRWLEGDAVEIVKRSGFSRIRNGKRLPYVQEVETWTCMYDPATKLVHEQRTGRVLTFIPANNKLLVGESSYQKMK